MTSYLITCKNPPSHFIEIIIKQKAKADTMYYQLPTWRPGRYELANYAQNLRDFNVCNEYGSQLSFKKTTKDRWEIEGKDAKEIVITYQYYANQLDAGASYADENQLYINPVNCLGYFEGEVDNPLELQIEIPTSFKIATALKFDSEKKVVLKDFHQFADSPFIASNNLQHETYKVKEYTFHIWLCGDARPDWEKIKKEFKAFSEAQIEMYGELPIEEYHFLFQLPPHKFYHGVEHLDSTVICIGPGYKLMEPEVYSDVLGISSHELFHSWNIKSIRPVEMHPYDYTKENYSRLGYVAEGVTTYYGDLMLLRSGVFNWEEYAVEFNTFLSRHFLNYGRHHLSVADSSFDTWLDGYKPGIPDRKVSIYVEGLFIAFMCDVELRKQTNNAKSLESVMHILYHDFAKQGKGYTEEDYRKVILSLAPAFNQNIFSDFIYGYKDFKPALDAALAYLGCYLEEKPSYDIAERCYGMKLKADDKKNTITAIAPDSPTEKAGFSLNDELLAINGTRIEDNFIDLIKHFGDVDYEILLSRNKRILTLKLKRDGKNHFGSYVIKRDESADLKLKENFSSWAGKNRV